MTNSPTRVSFPSRAMASALFACCSLFMFRVYGAIHWLPARFSTEEKAAFQGTLAVISGIRTELDIAYRLLALIAVAWCIWSWRTENRLAAGIVTVFAVPALFCAVFIVM